jgi:uncharacterized protein (TIGR03435 family)
MAQIPGFMRACSDTIFLTSDQGRFLATGFSVRDLIVYAYRLRNYQVIGASGWMLSDKWEIQGKIKEGDNPRPTGVLTEAMLTEPGPIALMVQSLLEDRFAFNMHREKREFPVYGLVVAKVGLKMKLNEQPDSGPVSFDQMHAAMVKGIVPRGTTRQSRGLFEGTGIPMFSIRNSLMGYFDRTIIDMTGLKGNYDFKLQWTPDPALDPGSFFGTTPTPDQLPAPSIFPSIFTALQEQLGLQLVSAKAPLDVVVIDSVRKPSEN